MPAAARKSRVVAPLKMNRAAPSALKANSASATLLKPANAKKKSAASVMNSSAARARTKPSAALAKSHAPIALPAIDRHVSMGHVPASLANAHRGLMARVRAFLVIVRHVLKGTVVRVLPADLGIVPHVQVSLRTVARALKVIVARVLAALVIVHHVVMARRPAPASRHVVRALKAIVVRGLVALVIVRVRQVAALVVQPDLALAVQLQLLLSP
jgi:hypothetical protein